jgi:hypothetical protein
MTGLTVSAFWPPSTASNGMKSRTSESQNADLIRNPIVRPFVREPSGRERLFPARILTSTRKGPLAPAARIFIELASNLNELALFAFFSNSTE